MLATLTAVLLTESPAATVVSPNACLARLPSTGWCGDGGPADAARLGNPGALAALPTGAVAVAERANDVIRMISPEGEISTLAQIVDHGRRCGFAQLDVDPSGGVIAVSPNCGRVFRVSAAGESVVLAGTGRRHPRPDPRPIGPAANVDLDRPTGVAVRGREVFVLDRAAVRVVTEGRSRVLGVRDMPARVRHVTVDRQGSLLLASRGAIWRREASGVLTRVAGRPRAWASGGDGGPAIDASFATIAAVDAAPDGSLFVAEGYGERVRRIDRHGRIQTIAGTGVTGFRGDGGPARLAWMRSPSGVLALGDGSVLIADADNDRIRRVGPRGRIATIAGDGPAAAADRWSWPFTEYEPHFNYLYIAAQHKRWRPRRIVRAASDLVRVPLTFSVVSSRAARVRYGVVRRDGYRPIRTFTGDLPAGRTTVRLRSTRAPLDAGGYEIVLQGRTADWARQESTTRLRLGAAPPR